VTLTEHERQALQRIAYDLAQDDPRLARLLTKARHTRRTRRIRRRRRVTVLTLTLVILGILALSMALSGA